MLRFIVHQTHAYDPEGSWQQVPHFCYRQSTPPRQLHDQNPLLQAGVEE